MKTKKYEFTSQSDEYEDTPAWVQVKLAEKDRLLIAKCQRFIVANKVFQVRLDFSGEWDTANTPMKIRYLTLIVLPHEVWAMVTNEWSGGTFETLLDNKDWRVK